MSRIYFTSDLHFCHKRIMQYAPTFRKYDSIPEMDEGLVELWNDKVTPDDDVYDLGDLLLGNLIEKSNLELLKRLNGRHHLILGNHDDSAIKYKPELLNIIKYDGNKLFDTITDYLEIKVNKQLICMSHYPMYIWNGCHQGSFMLYGHMHQELVKIPGRIMNVGYDLHGKLLSYENIVSYLGNLPKRKLDNNPGDDITIEDREIEIRTKLYMWNYTEEYIADIALGLKLRYDEFIK